METLQIDILNPKATRLLKDLAELNLISIHKKLKKTGKKDTSAVTSNSTYPFNPQYLRFNNTNYILHEKLDAPVSFEDGSYFISNRLLDIAVWGNTREEAEGAFAFAFHSLYENFAKETDKNLGKDAQLLKRKLKKLVLNTIDNNEG